MAKRKKKQVEEKARHVFAFMITPHDVLLISKEGAKVDQVPVDSGEQAKEYLESGKLLRTAYEKIGTGADEVSVEWVDDPAGNPVVVEACRKMEQPDAEQLLAGAVNAGKAAGEGTADDDVLGDERHPDAEIPAELVANTWGNVFQIERDGEWQNIPGKLLEVGEKVRYFPERSEPDETEWIVAAAPELVSKEGEEENHSIRLKRVEEKQAESDAPLTPQFKANGETKVMEVRCEGTFTEEKLKRLARELQSLKLEKSSMDADFNEKIKKVERALFEAANGGSFTHMECNIEEDVEAAKRRYVRPDNGEVVLEEDIPQSELQVKMDLADTPKPEDGAATSTENPEGTEPVQLVADYVADQPAGEVIYPPEAAEAAPVETQEAPANVA
jgi:hypothetical protein